VVSAFVLIQAELGRHTQVCTDVRRVAGVSAAEVVTGPYDVIAQVAAADMDALGRLIATGIQGVEGVTRTLTCPVVNV